MRYLTLLVDLVPPTTYDLVEGRKQVSLCMHRVQSIGWGALEGECILTCWAEIPITEPENTLL